MGSDPDGWRWGRLHTLMLTNQSFGESGIGPIEWLFNRGPYELGGGSSIVNADRVGCQRSATASTGCRRCA